MAIDPSLIDAIKGFEGYSPDAQWDYKQSSSGYGTKAQPGDENIPPDQRQAIFEQRLQDEVGKAAAHVDSVNPNLPAGARSALISLTYNAGPGWSQSGLGDLVRAGDLEGAKTRLQEYNKAGGKVNEGLVSRRAKEAAWFDGGPTASSAQPVAQNAPQRPAGMPISLAPPQAPIFAPQAGPQQQQPQGSVFAEMPAEQMAQLPPIMAPPRRSPDISKLRAALGNRGFIFSRG